MKKRILCRFIAAALAGCMFLQANVFAAEISSDDQMTVTVASAVESEEVDEAEGIIEDAVEESVETDDIEIDAADEIDINETEIDSIDVDDNEIVEDGISVVGSVKVPNVQESLGTDALVSQIEDEELVGANSIPKLTLNETSSFSFTMDPDKQPEELVQFFTFTPDEDSVYRVDITGGKGKIVSGVYYRDSSHNYKVIDRHIYVNNDLKYTVKLSKGVAYYFSVYPDTNRDDSGKIKIRKIETEITGADIKYYDNLYLTVGDNKSGQWAIKEDGSKDFNVFLFSTDTLKSMLNEIQFTLKKGNTVSTITWRPSDGYEIGNTGLLVVPQQITKDWNIDEDAFMNVYFGDRMTAEKIRILFFEDVYEPTNPYYKAIYWAANVGITKGYSDGTFGINRSCTRGEMMMFLWRYTGKREPISVPVSPFKDVPKNHTFYKAILWGAERGITKGYSDGTFGINRNVSRGECMMFLWRLKRNPAPTAVAKAPFPDVPKSHVFYNAVLWGYQNKITTGFTSGKLKGKFGVNEDCSRGQIVTFLYRQHN